MDSERGSERDLSEVHEDILTTSEDIEADATELKKIENQKTKVAAGDDSDLVALSETAEDLADRIKTKASVETALAKEAAEAD